jgi:hypothetical protein
MVQRVFHLLHIGFNFVEMSFNLDICTLDELHENDDIIELIGLLALEISKDRIFLHFLGLDLIDEAD